MLFQVLALSIFLLSSVTNAGSITIPMVLDGPFSEDLIYPEDGYSKGDPLLYNMQRLQVVKGTGLNFSYWEYSESEGIVGWFIGDPIKRVSVSMEGVKTNFNLPTLGQPEAINFEDFYLFIGNIYVVDKTDGSLHYFQEQMNSWLNLNTIFDFPVGQITKLYYHNQLLHIIIKSDEVCSIWTLSSELEKKFEFSGCLEPKFFEHFQDSNGEWWTQTNTNRVYSFKNTAILEEYSYLSGDTKSGMLSLRALEGLSKKHMIYEEAEIGGDLPAQYRSGGYKVDEGILYFSSNLSADGVTLYDVASDQLETIPHPISAQSFRTCNQGKFGTYCMFKMNGNIYAVYKFEDQKFILDSVFNLENYSDPLSEVGFAGAYGNKRLILLSDSNGYEYALEASNGEVVVLIKLEERYGISSVIGSAGVNHLLEFRVDGSRLHRYEWDTSQKTFPLVNDNEFPEYRRMQGEEGSKPGADKFLGIASLDYYFLLSVLLLLFRLRRRA